MKIALIIEHFDATRGGAEHFTVWLAQELVRRGHEVHVVCHDVAARVNRYRQATQRASHDADRSHQAHAGVEAVHEGMHIHRLRGMKLNSGLGFRIFGARARRWCQQNRPDIAHSITVAYPGDIYHPQAGVYAASQAQAVASRTSGTRAKFKQLMLRLSGKQRTLVNLEARAVNAPGRRPSSRRSGPKRIISLSDMMTRQFHDYYAFGRGSPPIIELPNPRMTRQEEMDPARIIEARAWFRGHYRLSRDDRVAVFVGHDFRRKGLRYAIEAIAKTRRWKLLVVGLGKAREYVEFADSLGIGDAAPHGRDGAQTSPGETAAGPRVLFVGPTKEMQKVYAASDALILPTFYDSFGLVALEAFSYGLPVISTEFLGAGYLVKEHDAGAIVASPRETEAMARALESLPLPGSAAHAALAARARTASTAMLPEAYMERILALYAQVTS